MSDQGGIGLKCPKFEKPLVLGSAAPIESDDQLAGSICAECGHVLTEEDIGAAIKNALDNLLTR